jgi:hypothetical protein
MMGRALGISLFLFFSVQLFSQVARDTVWVNGESKSRSQSFSSDTKASSKIVSHYIGLQANQLLRQLFNLSGNSGAINNPYTATYAFNGRNKGHGMSFGLGLLSENINDNNPGQQIQRDTKAMDIFFRVGYEWKIVLAPRWVWGWGVDALLIRSKRDTKTTQNSFTSEINTTSKGWGLGPRVSLLFNVSRSIYLGTEASWYYQSTQSDSELIFTGNPPQKSDLENSTFSLQVPVAIFLIVKF